MIGEDDLSTFYSTDDFAQDVTYTPSVGTAKVIPAIIDYGKGDEYQGSNSYDVNATMQIQAVGDDGITVVTNKDVVTIGVDTWNVIGARKINDGLEWEIEINRETV
ncbi:MAG: hypothetical protein A4E66_00162 [Syntrophus sp. PtaB.Bin001]|nr:MAG: hypothetical protein A4E66_00162 [Syntrophus sp. PtaB.Bin001]